MSEAPRQKSSIFCRGCFRRKDNIGCPNVLSVSREVLRWSIYVPWKFWMMLDSPNLQCLGPDLLVFFLLVCRVGSGRWISCARRSVGLFKSSCSLPLTYCVCKTTRTFLWSKYLLRRPTMTAKKHPAPASDPVFYIQNHCWMLSWYFSWVCYCAHVFVHEVELFLA